MIEGPRKDNPLPKLAELNQREAIKGPLAAYEAARKIALEAANAELKAAQAYSDALLTELGIKGKVAKNSRGTIRMKIDNLSVWYPIHNRIVLTGRQIKKNGTLGTQRTLSSWDFFTVED